MSKQILTLIDTSYVAEIHHYQQACPMRVTGTGFGDAEPPVDEEVDFTLYELPSMKEVDCEDTLKAAEIMLLDFLRN